MTRGRSFVLAAFASVCVAGAVAGQEGTGEGEGPAPLRRDDSVTLRLGKGGSGRVTLPGGDAVIPGDGSVLRTLTKLDAEGRARTTVELASGTFELQGSGGGPRIQVLGLDLLPGLGSATVTITDGQVHLEHAGGGPVVLRLGASPNAARVVLHEGGAVDLSRSGAQLQVSNAGDTGRVLLSETQGWSQLSAGGALQVSGDGSAPSVVRGEAAGGARPPEIPAVKPATGSEEIAARVGTGGSAVLLVSDGSAARAADGASVVGRWSGGHADRRATLAAAKGTVRVALRSARTSAETPAHRVNAGAQGATALSLTVNAEGERLEVDRSGGAAVISNELPHAGPRIRITVQAGDAIEYVAGDPAQGIRYRIPASNGERVAFTVGTKTLRADPGTEVIFRPDGKVEVLWPEGPEEVFRFAFAPDTLLPSVPVPYTGLPDLLPPPNVSPSKP